MIRFALVFVLVFGNAYALFSADPKSPVSEYYSPIQEGTKWIERNWILGAWRDSVFTVADVKEKNGVYTVTTSMTDTPSSGLHIIINGKDTFKPSTLPHMIYRVSREEVARLAEYDIGTEEWNYLSTPKTFFKALANPGDVWEGEDKKNRFKWKVTFVKRERIKVAAGTFDAVFFKSTGTKDGKTLSPYRQWFAKGIGLLKTEIDGKKVMELAKFTPGKPKAKAKPKAEPKAKK